MPSKKMSKNNQPKFWGPAIFEAKTLKTIRNRFLDDVIASQNKLIGWSDCLAQLVIMAGGYEVLQNPNHVQTWYGERPDLYPNYTDWRDAEIADYIKDIEIIKKL